MYCHLATLQTWHFAGLFETTTPSVSDQHWTMATIIETAKPKHFALAERCEDSLLISRRKTSTTMCILRHVSSVYWLNILLIFWHFAELVESWDTICFPAGESKVGADYLTSMVWSPHTQIWWNLIHRLFRFCRSARGRAVWHHDYPPQSFHHTWAYCCCHVQTL